MGTGRRDELEDESGKDIEHRSKGRVTKEMMGRHCETPFSVLPGCTLMEVGGQSRLPKDKPCHVGDGEIRPVRTQWTMVHSGNCSKMDGS